MPLVRSSSLALRIFGDDLQPNEVTCLLGPEPTFKRRKGEAHTSKRGRTYVAKTGTWILNAEDRKPADLDA